MYIQEFLFELTKEQKRRLYDIQQEIFDSGKYKDKDFVQKECWNEAVQILAKEMNVEIKDL